ncbi:COMM domain-containing protein 10-like [Toxorhynchites rutilus septentrionalis]|uniref:COMM domain-containing protein 10-like n=1 Tax=Toxorhynchites rutilus septentrionalis TaxID=329112 RepID=UPI0024784D51|nr:COMM domain-containing protein 10-like [Toxorhynchites rutilus septentrionalis]
MSSNPIWVTVTESVSRGIALCNERLTDDHYSHLIEYLFRTIDSPTESCTTDSEFDMDKLQLSCHLNEQEFKSVLQTMAYLVKRSLKYMLKPSAMQIDLRNRLLLDEDKCNIFVKYWIQSTKIILDSLETEHDGESGVRSNQLEDVSWKVRAQLSSEPRQKDKLALGQLELTTSNKVVNLELNSEEIVHLYNQLERIQVELDSFSVK